jgi:hypothetical protein
LIPLFETLHTGRAAPYFLSSQIDHLGLDVFSFQDIQGGVNQNARVALLTGTAVKSHDLHGSLPSCFCFQ